MTSIHTQQPPEVLHRWKQAQREFSAAPAAPSGPANRGGFVKGPIPLPWLQAAANLPGKTLHVGLCLWYLAGLTRSMTVRLATKVTQDMGISRDAKSDALRRLVKARLATLEQHPGKAPVVTLLAVDL